MFLVQFCTMFCLLSASNEWNLDGDSLYEDQYDEEYHETENSNADYHHHQQQQQQMQYLYKVETQTGMLLTSSSKQQTGFTIQSKIQMAQVGAETWLMKLTDITFKQVSSGDNGNKDKKMRVAKENQHVTKLLQLPVKFVRKSGKINKVAFDTDDEPWSMNIKRGTLNMFQVNLDTSRREENFENSASRKSSTGKFYTVYEESTEGGCMTNYAVHPVSHSNAGVHKAYNVTKSINFDTCLHRPYTAYNMDSMEMCSSDGATEKLLHSSSVTSYSIIGTPNRFLVINAQSQSQYTFGDLESSSDELISINKQDLKLIQSNGGTAIRQPSMMKESTTSGLIYSQEWDEEFEKSFMQGGSMLRSKGNSVTERAKALFQQLLITNTQSDQARQVNQVRQLTDLLRLCSVKDLDALEQSSKEGMNKSAQQPAKNFFIHTMGLCGSKACVQKLTSSLRVNSVSLPVAIMSLQQVAKAPLVSEDIVREILNLAQNADRMSSIDDYFLKQTLWFLSGTLINKLCSNALSRLAINQHKEITVCPPQFKQQFIQLVAKQLRDSRNWEDSLIYTKTLGNAGLMESLPILENLICRKNAQDSFVRNSAIYALRKILILRSKKISSILMPIINDPKEALQVKMSAVDVMLSGQLDESVINPLIVISRSDPQSQVSNFIRSALTRIAKSNSICGRKRAHNAKVALQVFGGPSTDPLLSQVETFSLNEDKSSRGTDFELMSSFINDSKSDQSGLFHRRINMHYNFDSLSQKYAVAVGLVNSGQKGLLSQSWFDSDVHTSQHTADEGSWGASWQDIDRTPKEDRDHERETSWSWTKDTPEHEDDERDKSVIYLQLMGQNIALLPFNGRAMRRMQTVIKSIENDLKKGVRLDILTPMSFYDVALKMPTASGYPISLSLTSFIVPKVKGIIQAEKAQRAKLTSNVDLSLSLSGSAIREMKVWSPIVYHGIKSQSTFLLNTDNSIRVETERINKKITMVQASIKLPHKVMKLAELDSKHSTLFATWNDFITINPESEHTLKCCANNEIKTKICHEETLTDSKMCINRCVSQPICDTTTVTLEPKTDSYQEVVIRMTVKPDEGFSKTGHQILVDNVKIETVAGHLRTTTVAKYSRDLMGHYRAFRVVMTKNPTTNSKKTELTCFDAIVDKSEGSGSKLKMLSSFNWGSATCASDHHVTLKGMFNLDNQELSTDDSTWSSKRQKGTVSSSGLSSGNVEISYSNLPIEWQNATNKLYRMLKHKWYNEADVADLNVQNSRNSILLKFNRALRLDDTHYDLTVKTPNENTMFSSLKIPLWILPDIRRSDSGSTIDERYQKSFSQRSNFRSTKEMNEDDEYNLNESWQSLSEEQSQFEEPVGSTPKFRSMYNDKDDERQKSKHTQKPIKQRELKREKPSLGLSERAPWVGSGMENSDEERDDSKSWMGSDDDQNFEEDADDVDRWPEKEKRKNGVPEKQKLQVVSDELYSGGKKCHISGKMVKTLHGVGYVFPFPKCFTILTKDCSPQRRFIIMIKKVEPENNDMKELFVLTRTHKILVPSNMKDQQRVMVNDMPIAVKERPTFLPDSKNIKLTMDMQRVKIELVDLELTITFDGSSADIKFSGTTADQQCGLCGQPNDQKQLDHSKWPDTSSPAYLKDLVTKYVVLDDNCRMSNNVRLEESKSVSLQSGPHFQKGSQFGRREKDYSEETLSLHNDKNLLDNSDFDYHRTVESKTKQKAELLEKVDVIRTGSKTCISILPLRSCPDDSYAVSEVLERVSYFCVHNNDPMADVMKKAHSDELIAKTGGMQPNMVRIVPIASDCAKF